MLNSYKPFKLFSLSQKLGVKPVFFIFLFFAFSISLKAQQNLVPNGDFELFTTCPSPNYPYYYVDRANDWFMPTTGSSDYFNSCSVYFDSTLGYFGLSVPENYIGYQEARSGNGYAGYYAVNVPLNNEYHEYMSVRLKQTLEKDHFYRLTYYISLADLKGGQPLQFIDHSGAFFSCSEININNWLRIDENPQVHSEPLVFLDDSTGWQKIEGSFVALGGEEYLTIGCFFKFEDISYNFLSGESVYSEPYYYIDDVSLSEIEFDFPNVFTPNGDDINDVVFKYENLKNLEVEILNRWGDLVNTVNFDEGWFGDDKDGLQLNEGVYFYVIKKEKKTIKTGFIHLIR